MLQPERVSDRCAMDDLIAALANHSMLCLNAAEPSWHNARGYSFDAQAEPARTTNAGSRALRAGGGYCVVRGSLRVLDG